MKKIITDYKLLGGIFFAYLLIYVSFDSKQVFWYLYTASMLFLISITIVNEKIDDEANTKLNFLYGIVSGVALYVLFFVGDWLLAFMPTSLSKQIPKIYSHFSLEWIWHYLVLFFIIVPGEEIFWRGFIQKKLMRYMNVKLAIILSAALNASAFIFSGYTVLIIAAFISGLAWGCLYAWKRSMPLLIISHLTFNLLLMIFLPLV
ncbi:CPBP family intramembrane glutamic endopeptidase [Bacillus sp. FJAT-50079]|uniref:CPBP family intramembrane glutamic endopeptidase n=1 Tax=Bacillus sp. FJAT-50079 TaxID=2833577 RepID=UPI001BC9088D|nr:CPBP family intramembrane glutamic endopeptidase [Bacillus sp. FJAT-50079]MBS4207809.1 CPBP family intramembrane metalloprotease [Bacillus sp. FJAT-50079]